MEAKLVSLRHCFAELKAPKFAALLLICHCILLGRSTNLWKVSDYAPTQGSKALPKSNYVRLLRFFATGIGDLLQKGVLRAVVRLAMQSGRAKCLVMDRTEWQHARHWRNLLVVGIAFEGYLVPLVWVDLAYHGCCNAPSRLALLERLSQWWPHAEVPLHRFPLVADREFSGEDWLLKAAKQGFRFVVRLKASRRMQLWGTLCGKSAPLRTLGRYLRQKRTERMEVLLAGEYVCHLVCLPKIPTSRDKEPYLYLLTNLDEPRQAKTLYRRRYTIECCFKHLKSNGFDLEKQGFVKIHQVEIITAVLVLLYTVCVVQGIIRQHKNLSVAKKSAVKTYQDGLTYPAKSLFRVGLTDVLRKSLQLNCLLCLVNELLNWLPVIYDD